MTLNPNTLFPFQQDHGRNLRRRGADGVAVRRAHRRLRTAGEPQTLSPPNLLTLSPKPHKPNPKP